MTAVSNDIRAAAEAGVVTRAQAEALIAFLESRRAALADAEAMGDSPPPSDSSPAIEPMEADNEKFRILGGFNDVFAAIGVGLLYGALMIAAGSVAPALISAVGAAAAWILSEIFTRRMRLALPSILLALLFAVSCAFSAILILAMVDGGGDLDGARRLALSSRWLGGFYGVVGGLAATLAAFLHHRRFGVPIDWAIGAAGLIAAALALAGGPFDLAAPTLFFAASGFAVFILALSLDLSDPLRQTTRGDAAFWLHLLAAPLMIHPLVGGLAGPLASLTAGRALMVLAVFAVLAVISLTIDRRALLVSALAYTGAALGFLVSGAGVASGAGVLILTLLALAAVVLSLSAGWTVLRGVIVPALPLGALAARLPPTRRSA